jgi:adenosine deaminase
MSELFIAALEQHDLQMIAHIPKGDLHNHAARGGSVIDIEEWAGVRIERLNHSFNDLSEMQSWYEAHVKCYCQGMAGYEVRIRAAFRQAKRDGVSRLVLTFGLGEEAPYGSLSNFSKTIEAIKNEIAPELDFIPEIAVGSDANLQEIYPICEAYFDHGFYRSIDINGKEMAQPPLAYQPLYRLAKSHGMTLRAHVGEFGTADAVREAAEVLELDEIQHGIAAAESKPTLRFLADTHLRLNVCPASNILLKRAKDYKTHPIRTLFDAGVKVTINTDDMLIFNVSCSEMYLRFFQEQVFSVKELDQIRETGLY